MPGAGWHSNEIIELFACVAILALGVAVLLRGARNPMATPLALLCIDMFVWNFADLAHNVSGIKAWGWLDMATSPFTPPLALHVVLAFVGATRTLRWLLLIAYGSFSALSLSALVVFVWPRAVWWNESPVFRAIFLALWIPMVLFELTILVRHWRRSTSFDEQWRARLILASVVVGAVFGSTEMWDDFVPVPALGPIGALGSMALIAAVVLRFRLFGRDLSSSTLLYAVTLGVAATFSYFAVFQMLRPHAALLVLGAASLTLAVVAAARDAVRSVNVRRERLRQLAGLGRLTAQMAHDVRNPLAALKGALQLVLEDQARGRTPDREYLELALGQAERIEAVTERYRKLSSVEPVKGPLSANDLVSAVLAQAALSVEQRKSAEAVRIERTLAENLPLLQGDRDLLAATLENVVRNACEAMPQGGALRVSTRFLAHDRSGGEVVIRIEDEGVGMDARQLERVFDDFFTTKVEGTGLGLGFVRRVVDAHGGAVRISSQPARGTVVEIALPAEQARAAQGAET
jgi:two-component system, NtrC family, sensor histidine kinase HydH